MESLRLKAFYNGKIFTCEDSNPWADTIITSWNKIFFVGKMNEAKGILENCYEKYDLGGKLVLPGFIDSHVHFIQGGLSKNRLDLGEVISFDELRNAINKYLTKKNGLWILGGNWYHEKFEEQKLPFAKLVDDLTGNIPLYLTRSDLHMALVNSAALKLAGINNKTIDPPNGLIERDFNGNPTGILKDSAMLLVQNLIPQPSETELIDGLTVALDEAKRNGVTSVHDMYLNSGVDSLKIYQNYKNLTCRVHFVHSFNQIDSLINLGIEKSFGNEKISIGSVKTFADGSLGSSTAWFYEEYLDANTCGLPLKEMLNDQNSNISLKAIENNLQVIIHAIGDKAVSEVINIYKKAKKVDKQRCRIEHIQHLKFDELNALTELGIIASIQPFHLYDDGDILEKRLGKNRVAEAFVINTLLKNKIKVCFGSDWTVSPLNPILGIHVAVNRNTRGGKTINPAEKISVEDAIKCFTINGAYAEFHEVEKGSLKAGKIADFVVLDQDIFTILPENIWDTKIKATIFDGNLIFSN